MMSIRVRSANAADAPQLITLIHDHAAFEQTMATISKDQLTKILVSHDPPVRLFVAENQQEAVGYAAATLDFSTWRASYWMHLDCLFVRSEWHGNGIGKRLLEYVANDAIHSGADRLEWQTPQWNADAIQFYHSLGALSAIKARFWRPLR